MVLSQVIQVVSRFLHLVSAATLCGGFQLLLAPEAKAFTNGTEPWPLFQGFWVWDKSIAIVLLVCNLTFKKLIVEGYHWIL
jgi:hypothetical protein